MRTLLLVPALTLVLSAQAPVDYPALKLEIEAAQKALREDLQAQWKSGKRGDQIKPDLDTALQAIRARAKGATGELKAACLIAEAAATAVAADLKPLTPRLLQEVPATSPAWKACPEDLLGYLPMILGPAGEAYIQQLGETGLPELRPVVQAGRVEYLIRRGKMGPAETLMAQLKTQYPSHAAVEKAAAHLAGELATTVGNQAPDFKLVDLDNPGVTLTKASFKGNYLLLDFWGTWCGFCVAELPTTHKLYTTYTARGLEILSLAADKRPEDVVAFRKKPNMPMPWRHAFIGREEGKQDPIVKAYGIQGYPSLFLIGPDGKILAKGMDLREEALEKTLAKFVK